MFCKKIIDIFQFRTQGGIRGSVRGHPVRSLHPRLRVARRLHATDFFLARLSPWNYYRQHCGSNPPMYCNFSKNF